MSTISKAYELFVNGKLPGGRESLLKSLTDGNAISENPVWMQGDKCLVHVYFRDPGLPGASATGMTLDESFSMILSGALPSAPTVSLFSVLDWTKKGETDVYYEGTIDLDTIPLQSAFSADSAAEELEVRVDIEVRNPGNTTRITYRANVSVSRQIYAGETAPGSVAAPAALLTSPDSSIWQLGVNNDGQPTCIKIL